MGWHGKSKVFFSVFVKKWLRSIFNVTVNVSLPFVPFNSYFLNRKDQINLDIKNIKLIGIPTTWAIPNNSIEGTS